MNVPYMVHSDSKRLTQVLFNLLSNAAKFTSDGDVTVTVKVADSKKPTGAVASFDHFNLLHFSVQDTGIGIAPDMQNRLFKPFSQVHTDAARNSGGHAGGTGLGLAISKHLVELMGGRIWVDSALGQGSTFHFTIRCAGDDHGRPSWLQPHPTGPVTLTPRSHLHDHNQQRMPRVLLVHPLSHTRDLIAATIAEWGIKCMVASSVEQARQILDFQPLHELYTVLVDHRAISIAERVEASSNELYPWTFPPLTPSSEFPDTVVNDHITVLQPPRVGDHETESPKDRVRRRLFSQLGVVAIRHTH